MKTVILFICFLPLFSFAQTDPSPISRKLNYAFTAGTGVSYFQYNSSKVKEHFASPEFRLGLNIQKQLLPNVSVQTGLRMGLKLKTAPVYTIEEYKSMPFRSLGSIDETTSRSDHYFIEIPLNVQYQYRKFKVGAGVVYRNLVQFDNYRYVAYHTTSDIGITPSLAYQLSDKLTINAEYYFGTISFFEGISYDTPSRATSTTLKAYNRFAQISIAYSLRKK